jgi:hypothetical protein
VTTCTTAMTVKACAACATGARASCSSAVTTAALHVCAAHGGITAVTCDSEIPTCVAARATVVAVAAITFELAGVAAVAWRSARACACGVRKTISTKQSSIRNLRRAVPEKYINACG